MSLPLRKVILTDALFKNWIILDKKQRLMENSLKYDKNDMKIKCSHLFKNEGIPSFEDEFFFKEDRM